MNPRTLAQIAADPRVESIHDEGPSDEGTRHDWWLYLTEGYVCPHMECGTIHENTVKDCADLLRTVITRVQWEQDQKEQNARWEARRKIPTFKLEHDHLALGPFKVGVEPASYITPRFAVWSQLQDIRFVVTVDGEAETFGTVHAVDPVQCFVTVGGSNSKRHPAPETLLIFEAAYHFHGKRHAPHLPARTNHFTTLAGAFTWLQWVYNQRND